MNSPTEQPPVESHRPWWKLHLLTWVLVLFVGGAVVVENVAVCISYPDFLDEQLEIKSVHEPPNDFHWEPVLPQFGWPFVYAEPKGSLPELDRYRFVIIASLHGMLWSFPLPMVYSLPCLFTNISISLLIFAATAFTTESYFRRQAKWHQFSIQFILALTSFVALLLANAKYDLVRLRGDWPWDNLVFFFIAVGLWCMFLTAWRFVAVGFGRIGGGSEDE